MLTSQTERENLYGTILKQAQEVLSLPGAEKIDHPSHYTNGAVEVIDAIEAWSLGFHLGNVVKYVARARLKGSELEDLKKARWYLDRAICRRERLQAAVVPK